VKFSDSGAALFAALLLLLALLLALLQVGQPAVLVSHFPQGLVCLRSGREGRLLFAVPLQLSIIACHTIRNARRCKNVPMSMFPPHGADMRPDF
jgi:hypothetical protein